MSSTFDEFARLGQEQLEATTATAASVAKGLQHIAAETTDYSKMSIETNSAYVEKLLESRSLDATIQAHAEYAQSAYEGFVAQAAKITELYANLAKLALKQFESVIAKVQVAARPVTAHALAAPAALQPVASPVAIQAPPASTKRQGSARR